MTPDETSSKGSDSVGRTIEGETNANSSGIFFHDLSVWREVTASLPDDYVLPNPESVRILLPKTAEFYRGLFLSAARPELIVDDQVWNRIKTAVPPHYKIPNPFFSDQEI